MYPERIKALKLRLISDCSIGVIKLANKGVGFESTHSFCSPIQKNLVLRTRTFYTPCIRENCGSLLAAAQNESFKKGERQLS